MGWVGMGVCVLFLKLMVAEAAACFVEPQHGQRCCHVQDAVHCFPGLIIVGSKKAGSTLLSTYINQHPEIHHARRKELHYFGHHDANDRLNNHTSYLLEFQPGFRLNVECTPAYMTSPSAIVDIATTTTAKVVVILRDPVDRAYSEYWMAYQINEQARPSLEWLQTNLVFLTKCLGVVNGVDVTIPDAIAFPAFLRYLEVARTTPAKYKSDTCLMFFPKERLQWPHLLQVRERFRHAGEATYQCLERFHDATRCGLGVVSQFPEFQPSTQRWINDSMYFPQMQHVLRHHPDALVLFYDDLVRDPIGVMGRVFDFAGVSPWNVTIRSKAETVADIDEFFPEFVRNSGWTTVPRPKLTRANREVFTQFFQSSLRKLNSLIPVPIEWFN